ncbi:MAG: YCF48-related protein, partial [Actinomycetota bacterium]|nr:YCF48-related protein [Actinomycetota bacterium]
MKAAALLVLGAVLTAVAGPFAGAATGAPARVRAQVRVTTQEVGTPYELFGVSFPDAQHGHVVGTVGTILSTVDGGASWQPQTAPLGVGEDGAAEVVDAVSFPDPQHGHAVGSTGSLLATSDGGATWASQPPPPPVQLDGNAVAWSFRAVSFSDANHGYAIGGRGSLLATTDAGASWQVFNNPGFGNLMGVVSIGPTQGQAVGWSGHVAGGIPFVTVATADGGKTWEPRPSDFGPGVDALNFNAVAFPDPLHGYAVGDGGRIVATADGGHTWTLQRGGANEVMSGVVFRDAKRGVVVATATLTTGVQKALVFATDDGGLTWVSRFAPDTVRLRGGVAFADQSTA